MLRRTPRPNVKRPYKENLTLHAYEEGIIARDIRQLQSELGREHGREDVTVSQLRLAFPRRYDPYQLAAVLKRMTTRPINPANRLARRQRRSFERRRWAYSFRPADQPQRKAA